MDPKIYEKMLKVRKSENLTLKKPRFLRDTFQHKGKTLPLEMRNYQTQMVFHTLLSKRFVIGDDCGLGKCVTRGSMISTTHGLIPIGDLHDWSRMKPDTFQGMKSDVKVLVDDAALPIRNFYYGGVKPTVKMKSRYGFEIEGSYVHPLLVWRDCNHEWVQMQDLKEGDYICIDRTEVDFPAECSDEALKLEPLQRALIGSRTFNVQYLRTLCDDKGLIQDSHLEFIALNVEQARQVQLVLLRFGIVSRRTEDSLALYGSDVDLFHQKIGFTSLLKNKVLEAASNPSSKSCEDTVPKVHEFTDDLRLQLENVGVSNVEGEMLSYALIQELLSLCEIHNLTSSKSYHVLKEVCISRYFYDPVVSLERGEAEVFDIEVDDSRHCFVANGIMSHNTLEMIATIAALWEKDTDLKFIVVTNTSVMNQWGDEIDKFTQGIKWRVAEGGPKKRHALYEDYFTNWDTDEPEVLIINYHRLKRDHRIFRTFAEGHRYAMALDECFTYDTPVLLKDGTTHRIGDIVEQKIPFKVQSYNTSTGKVEVKSIVNWFKKPSQKRTLLNIKTAHSGTITCTPSHEFYQEDGTKIAAEDLKVGGHVVHYVADPTSEEQMQIILGSLLGDGSVSHPDRARPGVNLYHTNSVYLKWKKSFLSSLGTSDTYIQGQARFRINASAHITDVIKGSGLYSTGKKVLTRDFLDAINPLGLAVWYADDGDYDTESGTVVISTDKYVQEEVDLLISYLEDQWNITCVYQEGVLKFDRTNSQILLDLFEHGLPSMEHKFGGKTAMTHQFTPLPGHGKDTILSIDESVEVGHVYDIEVEGNHNYFAQGILVSNCTAVKNPESQTHHVFRQLSLEADRVYGLTATLIKNNLEEGFGIYKVIVPTLFRTKKGFYDRYCVTRMQRIPGSKRKIPKIIGHTKAHTEAFREVISPFYLGRAKQDVATELPVLTTKDISMPMEKSQYIYYKEALEGLLTMNEGTEEEEERETTKLTQLIYCQEIVNSPHLIGNEVKSGKEEYFLQMLQEEFADEKVIVFTRFRAMVDRLQGLLEKGQGYSLGIEPGQGKNWEPAPETKVKKGLVRVTGAESSLQRDAGKRAFTETPNTNLIFITMAGAEAINLQEARVIIFYDLPWSAGDYIQIVGRLIRIGSPHDRVYAIHLLSETPDGCKTIDHHVRQTLDKKMGYIEQTLGERLVTDGAEVIRTASDGTDVEYIQVDSSGTSSLFDLLVEDAKNGGTKHEKD